MRFLIGTGAQTITSLTRFEIPIAYKTVRIVLSPDDVRYGGGGYLAIRETKSDPID